MAAEPFTDPAFSILDGDPALTDEHRADLYDVFHGSKDSAELAAKLQPLAIPDDTKRRLYVAKQQNEPAPVPVDKTTAAISRLAQIPPKVLDLAENHPNVLKALTAAAAAPEEGAQKPTGKPSTSGKGKGASKPKVAPTVSPDYPATPAGHALVQASDGGLYHIPAENVEQAKNIDPALKVLHVEDPEVEA